MVHKKFRLPP